MREPSPKNHPKWIWVEYRPRARTHPLSRPRVARHLRVTHGDAERRVEVPEPVVTLSRRLIEATDRWSSAASVSASGAELDAIKNLRDALLDAGHRVRKKSPDLCFTGGTPEWATPKTLEETLGAVTGRRPEMILVAASSQRPPHLKKS